MLKEWEVAQVCIDCIYVEQFLASILDRIEFLFTSAIALEKIRSHQVFSVGSHLIKQIV